MPVSTSLLERDEELATIELALESAAGGEGNVLTIEGEAGAGKTTLLGAAGALGEERGMLVVRARGGEYERDFPYGLVRQLFEPLLSSETGLRELLDGTAAPAAPIFEPALAPAEGTDPFAVQSGLHRLVVALAEARPLLIAVDDAQWGDLASLRALVYVGRRLEGLPASMALAVRTGEPGEHEALLDELRRERRARAIAPSPLSAAAAATLAATEVGRRPNERFAAACCDATAGNPFLLVELLRALDPGAMDGGSGDAERLAEVAAAGAARAILGRLERLGEHAADVARAVAVLEPNAEARLITALSGLPPETVTEACERLVVAHLLSDTRPVGFVHPLVRAAVLSEVPMPRRAADHARAARLLDEDGASGDAVAAHLLLAEPRGDRWAVAALRSCAEEALGRGAPEAAVGYLRRALREPPEKEERLAVSRELGVALLRASEPEGIEVLRAVRSTLRDPIARAEIAAEISMSLALRRPGEEGMLLLEESLAEIPESGVGTGLFLRGHLLMQIACGAERLPAGMPWPPAELPGADTVGGRLVLNLFGLLEVLGLGSVDRAGELAELVVSDPAAVEASTLAGLPPHLSLITLTLCDRGQRTWEVFEQTMEAAKRRGTTAGIANGPGSRGLCHYFEGNLSEAQADLEVALDLVRPTGMRVVISNWMTGLMRTLAARGECAAAQTLLDEVWRSREPGPGMPGAALLIARGELRHLTGRPAEARHDFLAAGERLRWLPRPNPEIFGWHTGLAETEAALGNGEEARRIAGEAVRLAREAGGIRGIGLSLRVQGAVSEGEEGIELLREARKILAGTRARLQHARALADLGAALRRANRRREAREPLREALELANRCGAPALEERVRTELAATGARPRKAALSGIESLTPSELRVARMAADGMTNPEIAQALVVSPKTVETHMRHVFQKLDVDRRTQLADRLAGT